MGLHFVTNFPLRPKEFTKGDARSRDPRRKAFEYDLIVSATDPQVERLRPVAFFEYKGLQEWDQEKFLYEAYRWLMLNHHALANRELGLRSEGLLRWDPFSSTTRPLESRDLEALRAHVSKFAPARGGRANGPSYSALLETQDPPRSGIEGSVIFSRPPLYLFQIWGHERRAKEYVRNLREAGLLANELNLIITTVERARKIRSVQRMADGES